MRKPDPDCIEVIDWIDSCNEDSPGWKRRKDYDNKPASCRSVGWVIKEDRWSVTIVGHGPRGKASREYCGDMTIPKVCITKRRRIKL